ncbi:MAG TPA: PQQ-binding-like beta-propeller repeat protein [Candidatus Baltobacteraceae bacterium]|jgi:hypothetical protein
MRWNLWVACAGAIVALCAVTPQSGIGKLDAVWCVSGDWGRLPAILVADGGATAIVGTSTGVTAYSTRDGRVLWQRANLQTPITLSGDRLIATGPHDTIVALQPSTARVLWRSPPLGSGALGLDADRELVAVAVAPASEDPDAYTDVVALASRDGTRRWRARGGVGLSLNPTVLPDVVLWSYSAGEPHFSYVDVFDRRTGVRRFETQRQYYAESTDDALWFVDDDVSDGVPPAHFDRYDGLTGKQLESYTYFPEPLRNKGRYDDADPMSSVRVPIAFTGRYFFLEIGGNTGDPVQRYRDSRLYRYDRFIDPQKQTPNHYDVRGEFDGIVASRVPLLHDGTTATLLMPSSESVYAERHFDFSQQLVAPTLQVRDVHLDAVHFIILTGTPNIGYVAASDSQSAWLAAFTAGGAAFLANRQSCDAPAAAAALPSGDAIVACKGILERVTPR